MKKLFEKTLSDFNSKISNIEWNMGNFLGLAWLIKNPNILNLASIPPGRIMVDDLSIDAYQALGIALLEKDREARTLEVIAAARRTLIADAAEITVDTIYRLHRILTTSEDPYSGMEPFSIKFSYLYSNAIKFLGKNKSDFIKFLIEPLRNCIRHNNAILLPQKDIIFKNNIDGIEIDIELRWTKNENNEIRLNLLKCHNIFQLMQKITYEFYKTIISQHVNTVSITESN